MLVFGDEVGNIVWTDLTKYLTAKTPAYSTLKVGFVADRPTKCQSGIFHFSKMLLKFAKNKD